MSDHGEAGTTFRIDQDHLETVLRQVQRGELSPPQAAAMLLPSAAETHCLARGQHPHHTTSLDKLIDRLGTPPSDVLQCWQFQLTEIARTHEADTDRPLPPLTTADLAIDARGRLSWQHHAYRPRPASKTTTEIHPDSAENIGQLVESIEKTAGEQNRSNTPRSHSEDPTNTDPTNTDPTNTDPTNTDPTNEEPTDTDCDNPVRIDIDEAVMGESSRGVRKTNQSESQSHLDRPPSYRKRRLIFAAILVSLTAIGSFLFAWPQWAQRSADDEPTDDQSLAALQTPVRRPPSRPTDAARSDRSPSFDSVGADRQPAELESLDTFDSFPPQPDPETQSGPRPLLEAMESPTDSLASWLPPEDELVKLPPLSLADDHDSKPPAVATAKPRSHLRSAMGNDSNKLAGDLDEENDSEPTEMPQPIRVASARSVELPSRGDTESHVPLWDHAAADLELSFPHEIPLTLTDHQSEWRVHDQRTETDVARIIHIDETTRLGWLDAAEASPSSFALIHGRLREGEGQTLFLRPEIEAEAWPIRLQQADVRPTWDLRHPLPPRVARIAIDFHLPDDVEFGWIEPLPETAVRRGRGLAVLRPADDENISLGLRIDLRGGRTLSCRLRFAARIDSRMPWHLISEPMLIEFADRLAEQMTTLASESERLAAVYQTANSADRRLLKLKQQHVAQWSANLNETSRRIAQLQSMVASLQSTGTMRCRVWIEWPDSEQTVLAME